MIMRCWHGGRFHDGSWVSCRLLLFADLVVCFCCLSTENDCLRTPQEIVAAWQQGIDRLLERGVTGRILLTTLSPTDFSGVSGPGLEHAYSQSTHGREEVY